MLKNIDFKQILPHLAILGLFYLLTIAYFSPEFFEKKTIAQDDIVRYEGMSKQTADYNAKNEEASLWTTSMFGGMPVYLFHAPFPDEPLRTLNAIFKGVFISEKAAHGLFMTMFCFYIGALCFGISWKIAALGAVAFGLSSYNLVLIDVGHITKLWAIAYIPLVLGSMYLVFRQKWFLGFALFALSLTLELRANHYQITFYLIFVCAFYVLTELYFAFQNKNFKPFALAMLLFVGAGILALGANAGRILTTMEYAKHSIRGKAELTPLASEKEKGGGEGLDRDYAFAWSQGIGETFTLLIPNFYGGSNNEKLDRKSEVAQLFRQAGQEMPEQWSYYWGDQPFTNAPIYAGAIVCFLFVLFLLVSENKHKYWLLAGVMITLFFAWGKNFELFNYPMFDYFPAFNKFRAVSMALSLTVLLMTLGGTWSLKTIFEQGFSEKLQKQILIAFGLTGGLSLLFALVGGGLLDFQTASDSQQKMPQALIDAMIADRKSMLRLDAFRSFLLVGLFVGVLYFFLKKRLSETLTFTLLLALITFDMWGIDKRYLNASDFQTGVKQTVHAPTPADDKILKDKGLHYRVFALANPFNDAQTSYYHRSVGGYFAAKMRRYQELIERQLDKQRSMIIDNLQKREPVDFEKLNILNMLDAKYIVFGDSEAEMVENPKALGAAWFVNKIRTVQNPDEEMQSLDNLNVSGEAVVDISKFKVSKTEFGKDSIATVKLLEYTPKKAVYESENSADGFVVFSEVYYPEGWQVKIDGKEISPIRANYILRGLEVPKGKHQITFEFAPSTYQTGTLITQISAILVGLALLGALGMAVVKP